METNSKSLKQKHNELRSKAFDLSEENKFRFDILNYKTDGMIFVASTIIVPLILSVFIAFIIPTSTSEIGETVFFSTYTISILVGLVFNCIRNKAGFFKNGYSWIYMFILAPTVVATFVGIFANLIFKIEISNSENVGTQFVNVISMLITEIVIIILALKYDRKLFGRIKETLKNKWKELIIITILGFIIMFLIVNIFFSAFIEGYLIGASQSDNQNTLVSIIKGEHGSSIKISYAILLFVFSVLVAPLCEEISMRNSYNLNASNRWLGFVASSMFFGFVHYGQSFDFEHMLSYTAAGFVLSGIFLYTKGNMTYSWIVHTLNNLVAFILLFVTTK
ncbi:CPBP family intramembrane glutamic endopeptidase [Spiroplasma endosymbiont of Diplazon laetatorius]|uniref:CPBP family intramembrane glutamic endopeptidase n=1 Tax=Spiroplasma endosymbiont of Diplazon laetatorius TaxID=3066322 RepID=UPI0030D2065B